MIGEECIGCGVSRFAAQTVHPDSAEIDRMLEMMSAESSTVPDTPEVLSFPNDEDEDSVVIGTRISGSMGAAAATDGPESPSLASRPTAESAMSSMTGSIVEETPYQGSPFAQSLGAEESLHAAEQGPSHPSCLPGQAPNGPGIVAGSENIIWRCLLCRITNSVLHSDCAGCKTSRLTLDNVFTFLTMAVKDSDPAKAKVTLALAFIASNFPRTALANKDMCSALVTALLLHGSQLNVAEAGMEALNVVSWNNLPLIELSGGFHALCTLMAKHTTSEKVALYGCRIADRSSIIVSPPSQNTIKHTGTVDTIVTVLRIHASNVEIARAACSALHNLAINCDENKSAIVASGGATVVLSTVSANVQDVEVARSGCAALDVLLTHTELTTGFADAGGLAIILTTMRCHPSIVGVTKCGCSILLWMMQTGVQESHRITVADAVDVILASLKICYSCAAAATKGCAVLFLLSGNQPDIKTAIIRAGGGVVLLSCLQHHCHDLAVVENALGVIYNSIGDVDAGEMLAVLSPQGAAIVIASVLAHTNSSAVVLHGCAILRKLTIIEEICPHIIQCGGIDALCAAARAHPAELKVAEHVCCSLRSLSRQAEFRAAIFQSGGVEIVLSLMQPHPDDVIIVEHGCGTLAQLANVGSDAASAIATRRGVTVISSAMAMHRLHPGAALQACEVLVNVDHHIDNFASRVNDEFIISMLDLHSENLSIVQAASTLCRKICVSNGGMRMLTGKGVRIFIAAVRKHANDPTVLRNGCAVLHILASAFQDCYSAMSECIGVEFVLAAMRAHPDDRLVHEDACWILWRITGGGNAKLNCKGIVEGNGLEVLFACLHSEIRKEITNGVVKQLCDILLSIADLDDCRDALVVAGGIDLLLALLASEQNNNNGDVFCVSCLLVERMVFNRDNHLALCMGGAIDHILKIIGQSKTCSGKMAKSACIALKCLTSSKDVNLAVMIAGGFHSIFGALRTVAPPRHKVYFEAQRLVAFDDVQFDCVLFLMKAYHDSALVSRQSCIELLQVLKRSDFSTRMKMKGPQPFTTYIKLIAESMWLALRSHHHDEDCLVAACETLAFLAAVSSRKYCNIIEDAGQAVRRSDDATLLAIIQFHKHAPRAVQAGCAVLRHLLPDGVKAANLPIELAEMVVEILQMHLSHASIVVHCCAILSTLAAKVRKEDLEKMAGTAFPSIPVALRNHCANDAAVGWGCSVMYHLAKRGQYLEIFGNEENLQLLLDALLAHESNDFICDKLWGILFHFVRMDSASRPIITYRNICQLMEFATRSKACDAGNACGVLSCISPDRFVQIAEADITSVVGQLLALMQLHAACADVAERACGVMHNLLSALKTGSEVVLPADIVEQMLSTLRTHRADPGVVVQACGVLRYLSLIPCHGSILVNLGGVDEFIACLHDYVRRGEVGVHVCEALRNLLLAEIEGAKSTILASGRTIPVLLSFLRYCEYLSLVPLRSVCLLIQELISDRHAEAIFVNHDGIEALVKALGARPLCSTKFIDTAVDEALEVVCGLLWTIVTDKADHLKLLRRVASSRRVLEQVLRHYSGNESNAIKVRSMLDAMESMPPQTPAQVTFSDQS